MSVSALALAVLSGPSFAEESCNLSDGYGMTPAAFLEEANACLAGVEGTYTDGELAGQLFRLAGEERAARGHSPVALLESLSDAARLHALDMAVRGYAAHADLEGRSHMDRVRMVERERLIGDFGANIVVVKAGLPAEQVQKAILADAVNAANFDRDAFDHMGVAAVEADGLLYVVELFAKVDGTFESPLPTLATPRMTLTAKIDEAYEPVGWSVVSPSGETLLRGIGQVLPATLPDIREGYLQMDVVHGTDVYTLRGPAIASSL